MRSPPGITGDDLVAWSERIDAAGSLPKLIRRLLLATVELGSLAIRADAGVRLAGWDGLVSAGKATPFCPAGLSVWELSTDKKPKAKIEADFTKRTAAPPQRVVPARATYVAVTSRRLANESKSSWVEQKKAAGPWADVKVLDADDLVTWLEQAPAVASWFASEHLARPVDDISEVETFLRRWSRRTRPPLPSSLALAGRNEIAGALRQWLREPAAQPFHLVADTKEEALVFAAAVIAGEENEERREAWLSRSLVVESPQAFRWALRAQGTDYLILLPAFASFDAGSAHGSAKVVIPHDPSEPSRGMSRLNRVPRWAIAQTLTSRGLSEQEAHRRANESGGKLASLQRLLGYQVLPSWALDQRRDALYAMLLVGRWTVGHEADAAVLSRLGADPAEVEALCTSLLHRADPPIALKDGAFVWAAPADAWKNLARGLTETDLRRFEEVAVEVLSEIDPALELEPQERLYAPLLGPRLSCSATLRTGIAESVARLSQSDEELRATFGVPRGSRLASSIVYRLLAPDWQVWASLDHLLPALAEAAPTVFLNRLEESLRLEDKDVSRLLAEGAGLLWALEALGWIPEHMPRVALALAELAARDPADEAGSRPFHSLDNLLCEWMPQSSSSVAERLAALKRVTEAYPDVGWGLALEMLAAHDVLLPSHRPQFIKRTLPHEDASASQQEVLEQQSGAVELLLELAGSSGERWAELVHRSALCSPQHRNRILDALQAAAGSIDDPEFRVWASLRREIHLCYLRIPGKAVPVERDDPALVALLENLYQVFEPSDPVGKWAWIFVPFADLPEAGDGDHKREEARREELRAIALEEILSGVEGWQSLHDLAQKASRFTGRPDGPEPGQLGYAVGLSRFAGEAEQRLLHRASGAAYAAIVPSFVRARFETAGIDWAEGVLRDLVAQRRNDEAAGAALALPQGSALWELIAAIGEPLESKYWARARPYGKHTPEEWERMVRILLDAGRYEAAVEAVYNSKKSVPALMALEVLERFRDARVTNAAGTEETDLPQVDGMSSFYLEQLFQWFDAEPDIDTARLAKLELLFVPLVQEYQPSARLFTMLEDSPAEFVAVLCHIYRKQSEPRPESPDPERESPARLMRELLRTWKGYPGWGLPPEQREQRLAEWTERVLELAAAEDRTVAAVHEAAKVLARAPDALDGMWPCLTARKLVESNRYPDLARQLVIAKRSLRRVVTKAFAEGGAKERAIAAMFRGWADQQRVRWPRTAALLDQLANAYDAEAEDEDRRAIAERLELDDVAPPARVQQSRVSTSAEVAAATSSPAQPAGRVSGLRIQNMRCISDLNLRLNGLTVLIGENGAGKSTILEACEILRRVTRTELLDDLDGIHGGLATLLRHGASQMKLGLTVDGADNGSPRLDYDLTIVPGRNGLAVLSRERLARVSEHEVQVLFDSSPFESRQVRQAQAHAELARLRSALEGIELHLPFEVSAAWADRAQGRGTSLRGAVLVRRAERLEMFAKNLANVYKQLRDGYDEQHWQDTMGYVRLGLGDHVEAVSTQSDPGGGHIALALKLRGRDEPLPAASLADGVLAYLAHVALFRLQRPGRSLLAFDDPDLHLHPQLVGRVLDYLEAISHDCPVLVATQSDRLLDALEEPAQSVVICDLDAARTTRLRHLDGSSLAEWLEDYRGVGEVREAGYLEAITRSSVLADREER